MRTQTAALSLVLCLFAVPALAARPAPVRFVVVDEAGAPIPTAGVRFALEEGERHRVSVVGRFAIGALYRTDGSPILLLPGSEVEVEVVAPGFAASRTTLVAAKRGPEHAIALRPLALELPAWDGASETWTRLGEQALAATQRWQRVELEQLADPTEEGALARREARREAARTASEWSRYARRGGVPVPLADELCRAAADEPDRCGE